MAHSEQAVGTHRQDGWAGESKGVGQGEAAFMTQNGGNGLSPRKSHMCTARLVVSVETRRVTGWSPEQLSHRLGESEQLILAG